MKELREQHLTVLKQKDTQELEKKQRGHERQNKMARFFENLQTNGKDT